MIHSSGVAGKHHLDITPRAVSLRRGDVGLNHDFHRGIDVLDAAHERDVGFEIALGVVRIAEDHGVLGNDAELPNAVRQFECLLGAELLFHVA